MPLAGKAGHRFALLLGPDELENWGSNNYYTYIRLPEGYDVAKLSSRLPAFLDKHLGEGAHAEFAENDEGRAPGHE